MFVNWSLDFGKRLYQKHVVGIDVYAGIDYSMYEPFMKDFFYLGLKTRDVVKLLNTRLSGVSPPSPPSPRHAGLSGTSSSGTTCLTSLVPLLQILHLPSLTRSCTECGRIIIVENLDGLADRSDLSEQ